MAKQITISAPGKLMLMGEHAVVYNRPCLVTALSQRMKVTAQKIDQSFFELEADDIGIRNYKKRISDLLTGAVSKEIRFAEAAMANFFATYPFNGGVRLEIFSEIPLKIGLGSSSAVVVCVIKALSELFGVNLDPTRVFNLSYKTILDVQKRGSGFDAAAAVWGGTLYFVTGGKVIEQVSDSLPLVVGYSGIKSDTPAMINQVAEKAKKHPEIIGEIFNQIEKIVESGKKALKNKDWKTLGELMNFNQGYLISLGVSTDRLTNMVNAAMAAGAWGAKISGAGGGDCIVALAPENKKNAIANAITNAGGKIISVNIDAPGMKVEK